MWKNGESTVEFVIYKRRIAPSPLRDARRLQSLIKIQLLLEFGNTERVKFA